MNKYDSIFNSDEYTEVELSIHEAIAAIAVITVLANNPSELVDPNLFLDILSNDFELFEEHDDQQMLEMLDRLIAILSEDGIGALFNAADDAIPDELVPDAYATALIMSLDPTTDQVKPEQEIFLKELQGVLDIDDEEAAEIMAELMDEYK